MIRHPRAHTGVRVVHFAETERLDVWCASHGVDAPHTAMLNAGWYNTSAAAIQKNMRFNSMNYYAPRERPSPYGFGSLIDTIMTLNMPGADRFVQVRTGAPWPSDHNMVLADVRLP